MRLLLIGPGRAGSSIVRVLARHGHRTVAVIDRDTPRLALPRWDLALIATPDTEIVRAARSLAAGVRGRAWNGRVALHLSGCVPSAALAPLRSRGVAVGSLHPAVAFPTPRTPASRLRGAFFGIEGDPKARAAALRIVKALGGRAVAIRPGRKDLYHAAAVLASNGLVALWEEAEQLLGAAGIPGAEAREFLAPLISGTASNLRARGPAAALTGPVARGEAPVVARELLGLARRRPPAAMLYRAMATSLLDLAARSGRLSQMQAAALRSILR